MATVNVASNAFLIRKTQNKRELSRKVLSRNARKGDRCAELCHGGVGSFHAACPVGSFSRPCHPYSASALIPNRRCRSGLLHQLQCLPLLLLRVPFPHSESLPTGFILSSSPCILKLNFYDSALPFRPKTSFFTCLLVLLIDHSPPLYSGISQNHSTTAFHSTFSRLLSSLLRGPLSP